MSDKLIEAVAKAICQANIDANSTPKPPFVRPPTGPLNTQELANSTMY